MKHYIKAFAAFCLAFAMAACIEDVNPAVAEEAEGVLSLSSMDVDVSVAEVVLHSAKGHDGQSRSSMDLSQFVITITNSAGRTVRTFKYADMPEILSLPVGTGYTLNVKSHDVQKAEWSKPYYLGSAKFDITADAITEVGQITCKFSNIKVTIKYDDKIAGKLGDDLVVRVVANDEGLLEFGPHETRSGYFQAIEGSTTLVATLTGTINGSYEEAQKIITDAKAGHHHVITFRPKQLPEPDPEKGNIDTGGLGIDVTVTEEDLNSNVNASEDLIDGTEQPGKEDWGDDPETPVVPVDPTGEITFDKGALSFDAPNNVKDFGDGPDQLPAKVVIKSKNPIAKLLVKIESDNANFLEAVADLMPTEFDLADPETDELANALSSIGLKVKDEVKGQTEVPFDITGLVPMLDIYSGVHKFTLVVEDNAKPATTETRVLTFVKE